MLLGMLDRGTPLPRALEVLGITHQQVWGRTVWDPEWAAGLETALAAGCPARPRQCCGTAIGYKLGGRCRACRTAHRGGRPEPAADAEEDFGL